MDIPQKIDEIIAKRKKLPQQLEDAAARIRRAQKSIRRMEDFRLRADDELSGKLAQVSTDTFFEKSDAVIKRLEHLHQRFSRDAIHISFVGRAGQGKSLVLQRISGLGSDVIPSAAGSDCTGAKSVISNCPGTETHAEITFFSKQEFVDNVNRYLDAIFHSEKYFVSSVAAVSRLNMAEISAEVSMDDVTAASLLEHLKKYVEHAAELQDWLNPENTTITVSKEKIAYYIAQYNSKDEGEKYYTYLGVKHANILSAFPYGQCGKIVLVDTIGAGATSLGVEEEMLKTVREDSDAIILMMRPDPLRYTDGLAENYRLIGKISNDLTPEYTKNMLFWTINRVESDQGHNVAVIPAVMELLERQKLPVARYLNVNCSERGEVEDKLLLPVLEQMSARLPEIDRMIMDRVNGELEDLGLAYRAISAQVERSMCAAVNKDERRAFHVQINKTIAAMTNDLRDLYLQRDKNKNTPCEQLKTAAAEKLKNVLRSVPKKEVTMKLLNDGTINQHNALEKLADKLRLQIINDFLELNYSLHEVVLEMKRDIVHTLAGKGCLRDAVNADPEDPDVWLRTLHEKLDREEFPLICNALGPLEDFDLRMENFLIYKVRCCLQPIDWSANERPPQLKNGLDNKEALSKEIESTLRYFLEIVHQKIEDELTDFYVFPNTALYAVLRDFYDRTACACGADGTKVEIEWQYLYENLIPVIWAEEHQKHSAAAERSEEWREIIGEMNVCAADRYFPLSIGGEKS